MKHGTIPYAIRLMNKPDRTSMKKTLLTISLFLAAFAAMAKNKPIEERPQDVITGTYRVCSNHSISTTLLGLEYSFEGRIADRWSLIGRAGLVPIGFALASTPGAFSASGQMGLGLTFEGRWYTSIARRASYGRSTYNNSSDFLMLRLRGNTGDGVEVSFTPAYGIRRSFGKYWMHEFTVGPKIGMTTNSGLFLSPHIQYRIGITF